MPSKSRKDKVWENAAKIRGKDPRLYRRDPYGNAMFYHSYGKISKMGWEVDHIKPSSRGGSDSTVNLQALNTKVNRGKGKTLKKKNRHSVKRRSR